MESRYCVHCGSRAAAEDTVGTERGCGGCGRSWPAAFRFCPVDGVILGPTASGSPREVSVRVVKGHALQDAYVLPTGTHLVGRDVAACAIIAPDDPYLSLVHAAIEVDERGVLITDRGSENGTFTASDGTTSLWHGAEVLVGTTVFEVALTQSEEASSAPIRDDSAPGADTRVSPGS
jgi:hypothetical protein